MPAPFATTLLALGAVLTSVSATAGAIVAGVGVAVQVVALVTSPEPQTPPADL